MAPGRVPAFVDPVEAQAPIRTRPGGGILFAAARAGRRIVAAGQHGLVVFSDDGGASWKQASVPVDVDLVGVAFPSESRGWAAGHGGVVLTSRDAGATWMTRLAGKQADDLTLRYYASLTLLTRDQDRALAIARIQATERRAQPFLDVMFESESAGFAVGAFNTAFRTEDGGASWVPWMDRTSNPLGLHFNAVRGWPGCVFLAGERGMVWRLRDGEARFTPVPTPYKGTLFGLVAPQHGPLLAFGMRGSAWRSVDLGQSWQAIHLQTSAGITGGVAQADGRITLVDLGGMLHVSHDDGRTFVASRPASAMPWYAVAEIGPNILALAGANGARVVTLS
jgi:photosystem II stability/assembly factor-like uncharacterized protein